MNGRLGFMAKFRFEGIDQYITTLGRIGGKQAEKVIKYAVYPGAGIIADAIRDALAHHKDTGDLISSLTLATMRNDNGYINTKIMFDGYDSKGVPNAIKAAALESGTSRGQPATHLITKAVNGARDRATEAMSHALDEKLGQIMEE